MKKLLILTLFLTGCLKVGPNYKPPEAPIQTAWKGGEVEEPLDQWWTVFKDTQLEELIYFARKQNLSLKIAAWRVIQARALLGIAVGEFFPQTQEIVGDVDRVKISKNAPNSRVIDRLYWNFDLALDIAWELDFWGKFRRVIESAEEDLLVTEADYNDALVILLGDVASTYIEIRTIEERIAILERNVAVQKRSLEIVQARFRAGMVTELDVQQAKTLLFTTRARLPILLAELEVGKNALATLLGVTPSETEHYLTRSGAIPQAPTTIAVGIPCTLLCRRPDIRAAYHRAGAQSARIGVAVAELLPSISLTGFFGLETTGDTTSDKVAGNKKMFSSDSWTYTYGGGFRWPILNYGRLTSRVKAEKALFYQSVFAYQNAILFAYQEVEDALANYTQSLKQTEELEKSAKAARRATQLSRTQYVEGIADYTRVLNTEEAVVEQEERLAIARGNIALSLVATYRALGGGWYCDLSATPKNPVLQAGDVGA
ncbi:MAG: Toluene efflux pump outer membrane protein TtgI [Chlamydiales bacterium]|nr:Toluene efflux pump outer membrane protein TtgI [Chlamydiales bacterium]MCH9619884.1 Toluene efflux pump outer membrane protein TtgI [Chlamydiales bacterium]MCH9622689.1 Toluene efflux pump outer membrane protein TtgI [Chlamydiales bacterium]